MVTSRGSGAEGLILPAATVQPGCWVGDELTTILNPLGLHPLPSQSLQAGIQGGRSLAQTFLAASFPVLRG